MNGISVIIPCHNNSRPLPWILTSVRASNISSIEIIVVDDESSESILPIAEAYDAKYVRLPKGGPGRRAMARQLGHSLSKYPISFYLDGDVIPEPKTFQTALDLHANSRNIVVKYPVYSIEESNHQHSLDKLAKLVISHDIHALGPSVRKHVGIDTRPLPKRLRGLPTKLWVLCASHCTSFERSHIDMVGGWDQDFFGWGEEDLELAYRLHLADVRFVYPHRKYGSGYHLDHPIDWQKNLASLYNNLDRFRKKYPESWIGRIGLLKQYLRENNLSLSNLPC